MDNLPKEVLSPEICPICRAKMEKLVSKYSYKKCPHCGYIQQDFLASPDSLKGALVGGGMSLGVSLLIHFLSKGSTK